RKRPAFARSASARSRRSFSGGGSAPAKRRARARGGEFHLRQGYGGQRRSFSGGVPRGEASRRRLERISQTSASRSTTRASTASEPGERSEPAKRRAREPVGESEGRSPSDKARRVLKNATVKGKGRRAKGKPRRYRMFRWPASFSNGAIWMMTSSA